MKSFSRTTLLFTFLSIVCLCSAESGKPEPYHVVLFFAFGVGLGIFFVQTLRYLGDPVHYTICLFISGVLLSLAGDGGHGPFGDSVSIWLTIDAELLLYVFLPPLIFGEAMHLNWYQARRAMLQASTLAGPGVLFGAMITGCFAKAIQPDWSWSLAMTFGAITSATDPVAVVALLKSAGASPKLTMIVVGESLLNDGTAMVLFEVFFQQLKGASFDFGNALLFVIRACLGSCILGGAVGYIAVRWLRAFKRPLNDTDVFMQIAITVCTAYTVFYVAQSTLELSGVLACCAAGIIFSWLAPPHILQHGAMKRVWGMMEWMLNTVIFLLAGLIIGAEAFVHVRASDWGCLVALYLVLMFVRGIVLAGCYPLISQVGYKCTSQEAVFLVWGGLRGAVGLALAMLAHRDGPEDMDEKTSRLLFYVGGIAAITLVLNATTTSALLLKLGLVSVPAEKKMVQASVLRKLQQSLCEDLVDIAVQFNFSEGELVEVCQNVSMLSSVDVKVLMADVATRRVGLKAPLLLSEGGMDDKQSAAGDTESQLDDAEVMSPLAVMSAQTSEGPAASPGQTRGKSGGQSEGWAGNGRFGIERLSPTKAPKKEAAANDAAMVDIGSGDSPNFTELASPGIHEPSKSAPSALLQHIRFAFLSVVRVHYWHDIETGRLPRGSKSERFLLYTIEVALDEVENEPDGARDWVCMKEKLDWVSYKFTVLCWLEQYLPERWCRSLSGYLNALESKGEERAAYMLTSFIAAHEYAQSKIHGYLCSESGESTESARSPEELQVVAESQWAVSCARQWLEIVNPDTIAAMRVRQTTGLLLTKLLEGINAMLEEGLVTEQDAEAAMATLDRDTYRMQQKGNLAVERLGEWFKNRRRHAQSQEEAVSSEWTRL